MKILRIILVVGGLALIGYGFYSALWNHEAATMDPNTTGFSQQVMGMIGVGLLAATAGFFMRRR